MSNSKLPIVGTILRPTPTLTVKGLRRSVQSHVAGRRSANAMSVVITGRVCGGELW